MASFSASDTSIGNDIRAERMRPGRELFRLDVLDEAAGVPVVVVFVVVGVSVPSVVVGALNDDGVDGSVTCDSILIMLSGIACSDGVGNDFLRLFPRSIRFTSSISLSSHFFSAKRRTTDVDSSPQLMVRKNCIKSSSFSMDAKCTGNGLSLVHDDEDDVDDDVDEIDRDENDIAIAVDDCGGSEAKYD